MDKIQLLLDQVKTNNLYNEKLLKEIEELKLSAKEEKLQDGKYGILLKHGYGSFIEDEGGLFKITKRSYGHNGVLVNPKNTDNDTSVSISRRHTWRFATPSEIEQGLIELAEKKGFVKGAKVKHGEHKFEISDIRLVSKVSQCISGQESDYLRKNGGNFLCAKGSIYAVPLPECELIPSHPEISIVSHTVGFNDDNIKIGCKTIYSDSLKRLHGAIEQWNSNTSGVPISGIQFTTDKIIVETSDLKQIANHFTK